MTILERVKRGEIPDEVASAAKDEGLEPEALAKSVASGKAVVLAKNGIKPLAIGENCRVKINANIGTSEDIADMKLEFRKADVALKAGADTLMDLSTGGPIDETRRAIIKNFKVPVGTVPIYEAAIKVISDKRSLVEMTEDEIFDAIELHSKDGVSFVTVHCGVTKRSVEKLKMYPRLFGIVSRGGSFLAEWIEYNERENPLYENFDRLLDIARRYDLVLSLGDGLRPGATHDATDAAQLEELYILGELTKRAQDSGVMVMIEGPGHVPLNQIEANVLLEKRICNGAPFYVLGPLPMDCAPGYDHITTAIGGALAAMAGADFICYVTPAEHLALPTVDEVKEGVIAAKIAAFCADRARGIKYAVERDYQMSLARVNLDWAKQIELSIDPDKARKIRLERAPKDDAVCTMCGEYCAIKISKRALHLKDKPKP